MDMIELKSSFLLGQRERGILERVSEIVFGQLNHVKCTLTGKQASNAHMHQNA